MNLPGNIIPCPAVAVPSRPGRFRFHFLFLSLAWLFCLGQWGRADQVFLQMDIHQAGSAAGGNLSYYAFAFLNTTNTPVTYDQVYSANTNYQFQGGVGPRSTTYGLGFGSVADMVNAFTNGAWKLVMNVGDASEQTYYFSMSASNLGADSFPAVQVTFPANGSVAVTNNPLFTWTGTNNWPEVDVDVHNGDYSFYNGTSLDGTATSWNAGQTLNDGTNYFDITYFISNAPAALTISTPTNGLGQSPAGWVSTNRLFAGDSSQFTVGLPVSLSSGGHFLVARYDFENTNSPGADSSGHGNDSNCGGGDGSTNSLDLDTFSTDAAIGSYSRDFMGHTFICFTPPGVAFTNLANAFSGSFSVSAWVQTTHSFNNDGDNADAGANLLFAEDANTNSTVPLALTGSKVAISVNDHNGVNTTLHSQTSVNDGQYHQIAVTRDQASGVLKVYVDGNLEGTASGSTDPLYINSIIALGGYFTDYNGLLDDVQIYSGVLADADVASLFANPGSTVPDVAASSGGPVVHYDFDEGTVLAADVSGNNNNVVYAGNFGGNGPGTSSDAAAGSGAVSFDGGSYLTASSNLLATLAGDFTVSLWLKTSQSFGNQYDYAWAGAGVIAADSPNGGAKDLIPVALTGGQVAFNVGDGNSDNTLNSSATVNDDNWHHVVVTRNQSTGERQIFIDGVLDSSDVATTVLLDTPVLLTIGAKSDASNPDPASPDYNGSNGYEGLLDDVQIYNRVLSAGEIAFLHNNPGAVVAGSQFAAALNSTGLNWITGGDTNWLVETTITHDGVSAAQSGPITDGQASYLQTTVPASGQISFYWKVSSEQGWDYLTFYINGVEQDAISGEVDWNQKTYTVAAGDVLRWEYTKDPDCCADGLDAGFLDQVSYVPNNGPDFKFALNTTTLNWSVTGNAQWFTETTNTYDGVAAAQSGAVTNSQSSTLSTVITGPATISFYWSSTANDPAGGFDYVFTIDNNYQDDIYGDTTWQQAGPFNIPAGQHTLSWTVYANGDTDPTQAGFLDQVSIVAATPPVITLNPFSQTNYPGYPVALLANASGYPAPSWQWFEVGNPNPIPNATGALFIPPNSGTPAVAGAYYAVAANFTGSATTLTANVSFAAALPPPDWTSAIKSPFSVNDYYYGCVADSAGNVYAAAEFSGTNGIGTNTVIAGSGGDAAAIVKQSAAGDTLWVGAITNDGNGYARTESVALAPANGVYAAGNFTGTNWLGTTPLTDGGFGSIFLARFDATGSNVWVNSIGGTGGLFTSLNCLVSDPSGNVTLSGVFSGTVNFGGTNTFTASGQQTFLAQYNATGALNWVVIPSGWFEYLASSGGRIYGAMMNTSTNASVGAVSVVTDRRWTLAALNSTNGQAIWLTGLGAGMGQGGPSVIDDVPGVTVSGTNLFLVGTAYGSTATFGLFTVTNLGTAGQYFARYDTNGTPQLAVGFGSQTTRPWAVTANAAGNVYASGDFDQVSTFGRQIIAATPQYPIGSDYFSQAFVAKFDRDGNPIWARPAISGTPTYTTQTNHVNFRGIAAAADGVWVSGFGQGTLTFGALTRYSNAEYLYFGSGGFGTVYVIWHNSGILAKVTDVGIPPVITQDLTNFNTQCGSYVNLAVTATNSAPLYYQWYWNGTNLIAGATNSTLNFYPASVAQSGNYSVSVVDAFGSVTSSVAMFTVADTTPPVVTLNGAASIVTACPANFVDPGATAYDACAGNLPVTIIGSLSQVPGTNLLSYVATDASGNSGTNTRTVVVVPVTNSPVISIVGANPMQVLLNGSFVDPGQSAMDFCGNAVSVTATGSVNTNADGIYTITYTATDGHGLSTTNTRTVLVEDAIQCVSAPAGLVSWWPGDGNSQDVLGAHNGTNVNGATIVAGFKGQAFSFDGTNSYVDIGTWSPGSTWSIEAWVNPSSLPAGQHIIAGGLAACLNWAIVLTDGHLGVVTRPSPSVCSQTTVSALPVSTNTWYHVVGTCDGIMARIYVNGVLQNSAPVWLNYTGYAARAGIGGGLFWAGNSFPGLIDEVAIYNRALADAEIGNIYNAGAQGKCTLNPAILSFAPASGLVGNVVTLKGTNFFNVTSVSFNGTPAIFTVGSAGEIAAYVPAGATTGPITVVTGIGAAVTAQNFTVATGTTACLPAPAGLAGWWPADGNALDEAARDDGALQGGVTYSPGEVGQAFAFNGTNAYVQFNASTNLNVGLHPGLTIEGWIDPANVSAPQAMVEWYSQYVGVQFWISTPTPNGTGPGCLYANVVDTIGYSHQIASAAGLVISNTFQHVGFTYDTNSGVASLYLNGALVAQQNLGSFTPQTSYNLYFGVNPQAGNYWAGLMDDFSIYNRNLSSEELGAIYNAGAIGKCPAPPVVVNQPANVSLNQGLTATFRVIASGTPPLTYQWYQGNQPLTNNAHVSGATNQSLTLVGISSADVGGYRVAITNAFGGTNSTVAFLAVTNVFDLQVLGVAGPAQAISGKPMQINWSVTNLGAAAFNGTFHDQVYLSPNAAGSNGTYYATFNFSGSIPAGQAVALSAFVTPNLSLSGNQWIVVNIDANGQVPGGNGETNTTTISVNPVNVILQPLPSLQVSYVSVPPSAFAGQPVTVTWGVTNAGTGGTSTTRWNDGVWLSTDGQIDITATFLGNVQNPTFLNAGGSYVSSFTLTLPQRIQGSYYFVVKTDSGQAVTELQRTNDTLAGGPTLVQVPPLPELEASIIAPPAAFSGQSAQVSWTVSNGGAGATMQNNWIDTVYLSPTNVMDTNAVLLGYVVHNGGLPSGGSYSVTNYPFSLPVGISGNYYFLLVADVNQQVYQLSREHSTAASSPVTQVLLTPPPDLAVQQVNAPATILSAHTFVVAAVIANVGASATPGASWNDNFYLSPTTNLNFNTAILLNSYGHYGSVQAGQSYTDVVTLTVPNGLAGTYYLFVDADAGNQIFELNKANNTGFAPAPITASAPLPDLVVTSVGAPATLAPGSAVSVSWTVKNRGTIDTAAAYWNDGVLLSSNMGGSNAITLGTFAHYGLLNPGDSYTVTNQPVAFPYGLSFGTYYLFVVANNNNSVYLGSNSVDQTSAPRPITLFSPLADLSASSVSAPASVVAGTVLNVGWAVTNLGPGRTYASYWNDSIYLSTNASDYLSTNALPLAHDLLLGSRQHVNDLFAGNSYSNSLGVVVPATVAGDFTLYVLADSEQRVVEDSIRSNNVAFATNQIEVQIAPAVLLPDLSVTQVSAPAQAFSSQNISVTYVVTNSGPARASGSWNDVVYLSPDPFFDVGSSFYLGYAYENLTVTNGGQYTNTVALPIPSGLSGYFYVFVIANAGNNLAEEDFDNNEGDAPDATLVSIPAPADLIVTGVQTPTNSLVGQPTTITYTVANQGVNAAQGNWTDAVYLSTNGQWNASAILVGYFQHDGTIGAGSNYVGYVFASLPGVTAGNYYVIVRPDVLNNLNENLGGSHNGSTTNTFSIDVPQLTLGTLQTSPLGQSQQKFFKVYVPAGQTLSVTLASDSPLSANQLYVRYGTIPDQIKYDFLGNDPSSPDQQVTVPATQAGWYYIMVLGDTVIGGLENVTVEASLLQFSLDSVAPIRGGNAGKVTVHLQGGQFNSQTAAKLLGPNSTVIAGTTRSIPSAAEMYVTFDLQGAATGLYNVQLTQPGNSPAVLNNAFTVSTGLGAKFSGSIKIPGAVRPGFFYSASLNYGNSGDQDMPAPLLVVSNSQNAVMTLDAKGTYAPGPVEVLGIAWDGPAGVLPPGSQYTIPVFFQVSAAASAHSVLRFNLGIIPANATPLNWSALTGSQPPAGVTPDAWAAIVYNIKSLMGSTAASFMQALADNATIYSQQGLRVDDLTSLQGLEINKALNFLSPTHKLAVTLDAAAPGQILGMNFGRLMPVLLDRRLQIGPFGRGWSHNFQVSLSQPATNVVDIIEPDGTHRIFSEQADQSWQVSPGDFGTIQPAGGGAFVLQENNGVTSRFDSSGHLVSIQEPNGNQISLTYSNGYLAAIRHSNGRQFTLSYNSLGRITLLTDSAGQSVQYFYDAAGEHLLSVVTPGNVTTAYSYVPATGTAADHSLQTITLPDGSHQNYAYDSLGRVVGTSQDNGTEQFEIAYDTLGGIYVTNAAGAMTAVRLGDRGQILQVTDPIGHIAATGYDTNFNLVSITWPAGQVSTLNYDSNGNATGLVNPLGQLIQAAYTNFSSLASLRDQLAQTTLLGSDASGNINKLTYPDQSAESFSYDNRGSFTNYYNRRGQLVRYAYDQDGQITQRTFPDGRVVGYQYDLRGHLTNIVDSAQGNTALRYDIRGYMTNISYPDGHGFAFAYNNVGHRTQRVDSDGYTLNYGYDAIGRLSSLSDGSSNLLVQYGYDTAGRLGQENKGNGTVTTYAYDLAGHMTSVTNYAPDGTVQSFYNYTLDANGNRLSMTTTAGVTLYQYDALNQLTGANYPGGRQVTYAYDAAGNRVSMADTGTNTTYTANSVNEYSAAGGATFLYDADGNLTNRTDASGTTAYQYDAENRLISMTTPSSDTWQYAYNGLDQRIAVTHNGAATHYVLDPADMVDVAAEYDGGGALIARYDNGIGLVSRLDGSGNAAFYSYDALGNVRALTGTNGLVVNAYDYDAFGAVTAMTGTVPNEFQFVGRYGVMAEPNALHFMRGRFYSVELGRFQSVDPTRFAGGMNLLTYAGNNPVRLIDPLGLQCMEGDFPEVDRYEPPDDSPNQTRDGADLNQATKEPLNVHVNSPSVGGYHLHLGALESQSAASGFSLSAGLFGGATVGFGPTVGAGVGTPPVGLPGGKLVGAFAGPVFLSAGYSITHGIAYFDLALEADEPEPVDTEDSDVRTPGDPNEKTGPAGYGPNALISASQPIPYTITFVNASSNTAPAHTITISDQLDPSLDPRTFRLTEIVFGVNTIQVPPNRSFLQTNLTLTTVDGPVQANVIAGVDIQSGRLFWSLTAIDPATGQSPLDPLLGLLPPDDTNHIGEGRVSYTVAPLAGLPTGTSITNGATITFDINPPITTPQVVNMLDAGTPQSIVTVSNAVSLDNTFIVSWSGTDNNGQSGLAGYNVYVSDNGGPFQLWLGNTTLTSAPFTGQPGHTYTFYSLAMDNAGNVQAPPSQPQTSVLVSTNLPPVIATITNVVIAPDNLVSVRIQATDPNGDNLSYSLVTAPPGATLKATNGLFRWRPTRASAGTTNFVTVAVTDDGVPPLSTSQTFVITVLDYLQLALGETNLQGGQTASIPVSLASNDGVTNLLFTVQVPENLLTNWTLAATAPQLGTATLQDFVTNILVTLNATPGQSLQGTQQLSTLTFSAVTNSVSGFITLPITSVNAVKPGGAGYSNYLAQAGTVILVQNEPLLSASLGADLSRSLKLYGKLGVDYQLMFNTNLTDPSGWQILLDYTQTNGVITLPLDSSRPVIFYRLHQP